MKTLASIVLVICTALAAHAQVRISELPEATNAAGAQFVIIQGGATKRIAEGTVRTIPATNVTGLGPFAIRTNLAISNITGLQGALDGKLATNGTLPAGNITGLGPFATATNLTAAQIDDFSNAVVAVAPPTTNASLLTTGTLEDARISTNIARTSQLVASNIAGLGLFATMTEASTARAALAMLIPTEETGVVWHPTNALSQDFPATMLASTGLNDETFGYIGTGDAAPTPVLFYGRFQNDVGDMPPGWRGWFVYDAPGFRSALGLGTFATASSTQVLSNLALSPEDSVVFASVNAGSLGTGIRQSGLDGVLRFDAATLERARLTPQYQFVLLGSSGSLAFGPDNTNGQFLTLSNLGINKEILAVWAARDMANYAIASSQTGLGVVTANMATTNTLATNPSGAPYPFYRLSTGSTINTVRTNSDSALIRSMFSNNYFSGRKRSQIDWAAPITVFIRLSAPLWPSGSVFQFALGYANGSPVLSNPAGSAIPFPSDVGIGFRLYRTNSPAAFRVELALKNSATNTNVVSLLTTKTLTPASDVQYIKFSYVPSGSTPRLLFSSIDPSGKETIVADSNLSFSNLPMTATTALHHVNWAAGVTGASTTSTNTDVDIEPPIILQ